MNWYKDSLYRIAGAIAEEDLGMRREFGGLVVNVERAAGTDRYGVNKEGKEWRTRMEYDYGFIASAKGEDGEGLDVYLGPNDKADDVFIVHQNNPKSGEFDEDKCMLGFATAAKAKKAYLQHFDSPKFFGGMSKIPFDEFKDIIDNKKTGKVKWKKKAKKVRI